jgi:polysaccharide export outer membrane protein
MRYLIITAVIVIFTGCLRYTPSHRELESSEQKSQGTPNLLNGIDAFNGYETTLSQRVAALIDERKNLLANTGSEGGYPLGAGDVLDVSVFGFNNLTANSAVASDGAVILPLVGRVDVGGLPVEDAQSAIAKRYSRFIRTPQVLVSLKTFSTSRVSVMGEVNKPGTYPLTRRGLLLTEILSEAGGRSPAAGTRIILLPTPKIREPIPARNSSPPKLSLVNSVAEENGSGIEIDLEDLIGTIDRRPLLIPLAPGDTIIVPEAGTYEVDGEVITPGSFKLTGRTSVIGAIAAAKGFTYSADVNNVELIRDVGAGRKALIALDLEEVGLRGGPDIRLRNGDLVRIPSHSGKFFKRQIVEAINGIFNGFGMNQRVN